MFNILLKNNRLKVPVLLYNSKTSYSVDSIFDTGAIITCFDYNSTQELKDYTHTNKVRNIQGFVDGAIVSFEEIIVPQLVIGNISLFDQYVYVTTDKHVQETVLGIDIISQIDFAFSSDRRLLSIRPANLKVITNESVSQTLYTYLNSIGKFSDANMKYIKRLLPTHIEMPREEFCKLVDQILQH